MTFAWYAHLETLEHKPWIIATLCLLGAVLTIPAIGSRDIDTLAPTSPVVNR